MQKNAPLIVTLIIGALLAIGASLVVREWEAERAREAFSHAASQQGANFHQRLSSALEAVESVQKAFKKAATDAGVSWATPHILKHTAISWLAELGWTVDQIADFTETNPDTVRRIYRKFSPDYIQDVSESLSNRLFAPTPLAQTQIRSVS